MARRSLRLSLVRRNQNKKKRPSPVSPPVSMSTESPNNSINTNTNTNIISPSHRGRDSGVVSVSSDAGEMDHGSSLLSVGARDVPLPTDSGTEEETATETITRTTTRDTMEEENTDETSHSMLLLDDHTMLSNQDSMVLPSLTDRDDSSSFLADHDIDTVADADADPDAEHEHGHEHEHDHEPEYNQTYIEEKEMRRKLMEMESSFLPEPSTIEIASTGQRQGMDDTFLVGVEDYTNPERKYDDDYDDDGVSGNRNNLLPSVDGVQLSFVSQNTQNEELPEIIEESHLDLNTPSHKDNSTLLDVSPPSSPAAAAAARNDFRTYSFSSSNRGASVIHIPQEQQEQQRQQEEGQQEHPSTDADNIAGLGAGIFSRTVLKQSNLFADIVPEAEADTAAARSSSSSSVRGSRPKYLSSRQSSHRLSYSSVASTNTETTNSDATLGADYALQSGGAVPGSHNGSQTAKRNILARSVSLGSMASGISGYSEENILEKRNPSTGGGGGSLVDGGLQTLNEEEVSTSRPGSSSHQEEARTAEETAPMTPRAKQPPTLQLQQHQEQQQQQQQQQQQTQAPQDFSALTDTAITERVKDIQVPGSFARQFREKFDQRTGAPPTPAFARSGKTMTLKEQSSTIDRLSKENFDLKMRIHFLNEALNKRSEEGIKEMISENVELKSDKLRLQKEHQSLKRKLRDLEKQLRDRDQQSDRGSMINNDPDAPSEDDDRADPAQEEEILFLRERMETYEIEIDRLRSESIARESEKRRLAEMVKSLSDNRTIGSDVGAREERDMWKDMLDAETAAREQAEEENKRLRDEMLRLKTDLIPTLAAASAAAATSSSKPGSRDRMGSVVSYATSSDREINRNTTSGSSTLVVELELLKQENAELRKEVSAQTSMLTSRNREKERLYQEIEELKLGQRREGGRSVAGDSIFDRSASRAHVRSSSRTSDETANNHLNNGGGGVNSSASQLSDAERDDWEAKTGQLRDQVSALKLENQTLRAQLEDCTQELDALDKAYQADVDQAEEEIQNLQTERDQALHMAEERDAAFQDLRAEAQEELDALGEELEGKIDECQRLDEELQAQDANLKVLQAEMRSASEGIIRLEEDAQNNLHKYKAVQQELQESNREIESLEKALIESNAKLQRLTVQNESSQNEIAFLREEQDGDKIKIGDLESELKTYQLGLQSERDKTRELEDRLADERHQREVVGSKEKQEVQRIVNELNREAAAAKEEARRLKKSLSAQEIETTTWRERLLDWENNLRETLGDLTGSRSSLITNITKLQKELESTALELESVRASLDEKESLLRNRDALLESHGLESRKLGEMLERERAARRADKQSFEQALKSHHHASRTITQSNSRISELEAARSQDRKRFATLEQQTKDQLNERNAMLLTIWKRLSAMCGPDWAHSNSLINGNLPSQEVIGNILFWPGFSRNLLLAVKTVETVLANFKTRIKAVDRELTKQYQTLEHTFTQRVKRLERLEESAKNMRAAQQQQQQHNHHSRNHSNPSPEMAKLRGENRLLRAELNLLQSSSPHSRSRGSGLRQPGSPGHPPPQEGSQPPPFLARHQTTPLTVEQTGSSSQLARSERGLARSATSTGIPQPSHLSSSSSSAAATMLTNNAAGTSALTVHTATSGTTAAAAGAPSDGPPLAPRMDRSPIHDEATQKWIHRLHELEKRLKAEREGRLLDRTGARKRLEERDAENQRLRAQLVREREKRGVPAPSGTMTDTSTDDDGHIIGRRVLHHHHHHHHRTERFPSSSGTASGTGDERDHVADEQSSSEGEGIVVDIEV
ncbi:hypothetical protein ASPZODRAFT_146079 [Penicilliopsis zonata CBS 506.65]|uniref:Centrosomin N-terminal motif 1 domain-containing protein n=1 Tax=Penicilliopsis zonata CBS 506.65 TaxID=1073090 RepID=A0A1L9S878_9EURO|nr:hypothetical protein ASPZODRAFT_146079 [Penicilliopsis zonata CBS 506.65]OJJ43365.1 hypothetical protein ASPZODRAFT_146079 [Penicilliopsis zonata CBS 506.65]